MKNENINALDEIHKGCFMGMDAINCVLKKVENKKFKKVLKTEYDHYDDMSKEIEKLYSKYDKNDDPQKTNIMTKAMTYSSVEMKTMMDESDSKLAELMLQGINMGIIEGKKIQNNKVLDKEVSNLVDKYIDMQENSIEVLKQYL